VRVDEQINALPPAGIGKKSAHGIGGLSAAAFLVDDAQHMPANRITVYEWLGVVGPS
jgi:myosin-crossreactive antigen